MPADAREECLPRPGKSRAGLRWVYRLDGHRKCWFQAAGVIKVKRTVRYRGAKTTITASAETESTERKRKAVVNARAELVHSAPVETPVARPTSELKMVDAAPLLATAAAALVPPAPIEKLAIDRLTPDHHTKSQVPVETLLAATPGTQDQVGSAPNGALLAFPIAEELHDGRGSTTTWVGLLLMALGLISALSASRIIREAVLRHH